jgi:superfamily II DNA/RNA helicase
MDMTEIERHIMWVQKMTNNDKAKTVIFVIGPEHRDKMVSNLRRRGFVVATLVLHKTAEKALQRFRNEAQILVTTDRFALGVDLGFADGLINYGMPEDMAIRIQRQGRVYRISGTDKCVTDIYPNKSRDAHSYILEAAQTTKVKRDKGKVSKKKEVKK